MADAATDLVDNASGGEYATPSDEHAVTSGQDALTSDQDAVTSDKQAGGVLDAIDQGDLDGFGLDDIEQARETATSEDDEEGEEGPPDELAAHVRSCEVVVQLQTEEDGGSTSGLESFLARFDQRRAFQRRPLTSAEQRALAERITQDATGAGQAGTYASEWSELASEWAGDDLALAWVIKQSVPRGTEYDCGLSDPLSSPVLFLLLHPAAGQTSWDHTCPTTLLLRQTGLYDLAESGAVCLFDTHNHPHSSQNGHPDQAHPAQGFWPCGMQPYFEQRLEQLLATRAQLRTRQLLVVCGATNAGLVKAHVRAVDPDHDSYTVLIPIPAGDPVTRRPHAEVEVLAWEEAGCLSTALLCCHPSDALYARKAQFEEAHIRSIALDCVLTDLHQLVGRREPSPEGPDLPVNVFSRVKEDVVQLPVWQELRRLERTCLDLSFEELEARTSTSFILWARTLLQSTDITSTLALPPDTVDMLQRRAPLRLVRRLLVAKACATRATPTVPLQRSGIGVPLDVGVGLVQQQQDQEADQSVTASASTGVPLQRSGLGVPLDTGVGLVQGQEDQEADQSVTASASTVVPLQRSGIGVPIDVGVGLVQR